MSKTKRKFELLTALGESTDVPERLPSRGHPYWKSTVLRRRAIGHADAVSIVWANVDGGEVRRLAK